MPVLRRRKRALRDYDDQDIAHLLHHKGYFSRFGIDDSRSQFDEKGFHEAWDLLREALLPQFLSQFPGKRPFAWWRCDAPERRRRINGKPHPFDNRQRITEIERITKTPGASPNFTEWMHWLSYGKPRMMCVPDDYQAEHETELGYLRRLSLLTPFETKHFRAYQTT